MIVVVQRVLGYITAKIDGKGFRSDVTSRHHRVAPGRYAAPTA